MDLKLGAEFFVAKFYKIKITEVNNQSFFFTFYEGAVTDIMIMFSAKLISDWSKKIIYFWNNFCCRNKLCISIKKNL